MLEASKELIEATNNVEIAFFSTFLTYISKAESAKVKPNENPQLIDECNQLIGEAVEKLQSSHFASPAHGILWEAIREVIADGEVPDLVTIENKFPTENKSDLVRMLVYYLSPEKADTIKWSNCKYYLEKVLQYATQREAMSLLQTSADLICNPSDDIVEDINDTISRLGVIAEVAENQSTNVPLSPEFPNRKKKKFFERLKGANGKQTMPPSGFKALDEVIRFEEGEIVVLGARPRMGKSALASAIACNVADNDKDKAVLFFSLEMSDDACYKRIASSKLRIPHSKIRDGELSETELELINDLVDNEYNNLYIFDDCRQIDQICGRIRRINAIQPVSLVVLDYLGLIMPGEQERGNDNLVTMLASFLQKLKATITQLKLPMLLLCQLNREVETLRDHVPQMNHLRDSGNIEQDAGIIMFLRRPVCYSSSEELEDLTEVQKQLALIDVVKYRNGDPKKDIPLRFEGEYVSFKDFENEEPKQETKPKKRGRPRKNKQEELKFGGTTVANKDIPL